MTGDLNEPQMGEMVQPTLREIRAAHADLFHPNQDWFDGEAFMDVEATPSSNTPRFLPFAPDCQRLPSAATLALAYVGDPTAAVWRNYIWTRDKDHLGQRVYVGDNGKGLEIHRHIHLTARFGVAIWD